MKRGCAQAKSDGSVHGCRVSATRNNDPDEVNLKMNRKTASYRTNIAAKREPAVLVVGKLRKTSNLPDLRSKLNVRQGELAGGAPGWLNDAGLAAADPPGPAERQPGTGWPIWTPPDAGAAERLLV